MNREIRATIIDDSSLVQKQVKHIIEHKLHGQVIAQFIALAPAFIWMGEDSNLQFLTDVICDIQLPEGRGEELKRFLDEKNYQGNFIFLSTEEPQDVTFDAFVHKTEIIHGGLERALTSLQ